MTKNPTPVARKPAVTAAASAPSRRKARAQPPLSYLDVLAVAEACVMECLRLTMLGGKPPVALSTALAYESFRKQARGEVPQSPSYEAGFGDAADNNELCHRYAICLETLIEGELLRYVGTQPLYEPSGEAGVVELHGIIELTPALMDQVDLAEEVDS